MPRRSEPDGGQFLAQLGFLPGPAEVACLVVVLLGSHRSGVEQLDLFDEALVSVVACPLLLDHLPAQLGEGRSTWVYSDMVMGLIGI